MIFKAERTVREKAELAKQLAEEESRNAVGKTEQLENQIKNLKLDKEKAMQLSMKAIAARSNIKQYLDDEKNRNQEMQNQMELLKHNIMEAEQER